MKSTCRDVSTEIKPRPKRSSRSWWHGHVYDTVASNVHELIPEAGDDGRGAILPHNLMQRGIRVPEREVDHQTFPT